MSYIKILVIIIFHPSNEMLNIKPAITVWPIRSRRREKAH